MAHRTIRNKIAEKELKEKEVYDNKVKLLKRDLAIATGTAEGIIFARYIMELCGFFQSDVIMNPKTREINSEATLYNCMRSNLWLEVRSLLPKKTRIKIENEKTNLNVEDL